MSALDDTFLRSLARLELAVARLRARGDGGRRADLRGGRVEFSGHRPYSPGDDVRTIDWPAVARSGRLHVKEFERGADLDLLLVVDASASMGFAGKLDAAQRLAYALGWIAIRSDARVRVALAAGGELQVSEDLRGPAGAASLRTALLRATPAGETILSRSLSRVPPPGHRTRVVVVLSDLLAEDDGRRALAPLTERGDDVVLLHVHAAEDLGAADEDETLLEDAETGERVAADAGAGDRARLYAAQAEASWRAFAARHHIRYLPVDAAEPIDAATVRALRAAGILA